MPEVGDRPPASGLRHPSFPNPPFAASDGDAPRGCYMLRMAISALAAITSIFVLAGFVKGVVGLGLPTVAMGLLAVVMAPAQAAALLVVPSFLTNTWQALGPELLPLTRRL